MICNETFRPFEFVLLAIFNSRKAIFGQFWLKIAHLHRVIQNLRSFSSNISGCSILTLFIFKHSQIQFWTNSAQIIALDSRAGIRRYRGVNARSDLSGEAPRGDSTPSKHSFIYFYFYILII